MKRISYPGLAILCAITGIAVSKVSAKYHRANLLYKYIGPYTTVTSVVTNLSNWTLTTVNTSGCVVSENHACIIETTTGNGQVVVLGGSTRHIPKKVYGTGGKATAGGFGTTIVLFGYNKD